MLIRKTLIQCFSKRKNYRRGRVFLLLKSLYGTKREEMSKEGKGFSTFLLHVSKREVNNSEYNVIMAAKRCSANTIYCICILFILFLTSSGLEEQLSDQIAPPPASEVRALQLFCLKIDGCATSLNWQLEPNAEKAFLENNIIDPCRSGWTGVKCLHDPRKGITHIHHLDLPSKQLSGSCSDSLAELQSIPMLSHLALYDNSLFGSLPPLWLPNLKLLRLDQNMLSGSLPVDILVTARDNLVYVDLSRNKFSGRLPGEIGRLRKLEKLYLYDCSFTGNIPHELGTLPLLKELRLDNNQLSGQLPAFASEPVQNVMKNYLSNSDENGPTDEFLDPISMQQEMLSIEYMDLHSNKLEGTLPTSLGSLRSLKELHLYSNFLSGSIPSAISHLHALTALRLDNNSLSGQIPHELSKLKNLQFLGLGGKNNKLSGQIPDYANYRRNVTAQGRVCNTHEVAQNITERYRILREGDPPLELDEASVRAMNARKTGVVFHNRTM